MPFVGCCALVYFWTLRFSRIGDFYTLRLGFFGNLDLRIIYVFIPYWLMIMPLFIGSQMFLNELAFCRWVKKGTENTIQFLFL